MDNLIHRLRYERDDGARDEAADELSRLRAENAKQAERIAELAKERDSNLRMFQAAILDLASISEKLAVDPDEGGAVPIIEAIDELEATIAAQSAALAVAKEALDKCLDGFEFTRQYVGHEVLPAIKGWSWFDGKVAAKEVLAAIDALPKAPDAWLPIEAAPKDGTSVLINNGLALYPFAAFQKNGRWYCSNSGAWVGDPTHWQPLPPAPEGEV